MLLALAGTALGQAQVTDVRAALAPQGGVIRLAFDAPLESAFGDVEVLNPDGRPVGGAPRLLPGDDQTVVVAVEEGQEVRRVRWRVLSKDGHVTAGVLGDPFTDTPDSPVATVLTAVGRGLLITGFAVVLGLVVLRWWVVGPAWRQGGLVPPGRRDDGDAFRERAFPVLEWASNRWWAALWAGVAAAALGVGLVAGGTMRSLRSWDLGTLITETRIGLALLVMLLACVATAVAGVLVTRRRDGDDPLPPAWQALALGAPSLVALVAVSWSGHAATGGDETLNVLLDAVHNLATAAWVGGLVGLLALLLSAGRRLDPADRTRLVSAGVVRFSTLGVIAVALLAVTGVYRALAELDSLGDLVDTRYGLALLVKLVLFGGMLASAAYNRLVLHPRLERAGLGLDPDDRGAAAALRTSVRAELALAAGILAMVAILVSSPPPAL